MKHIFISLFIFLSCVSVAHADDVSLFSFVTDPQTVAPGVVSKEITVQAQSAPGVSQTIPETYDLSFVSSSATGQFQNSSGNAVSTVMSKNTANRTFYYIDSTEGDVLLTVTATGRESKKTFTTTQHITISTSQPSSGETASSTTSGSQTSSSGSTTSTGSANSAHSSPAPLSNTSTTMDFEISAGRSRLTTVGNPIVFRADATKTINVSEQNIMYSWSFGDGTVAQGKIVSHVYRFPGDYAVVLNGSFSDKSAVARAAVRVVAPVLSMHRVPGGIEVNNISATEINLGGWKLIGQREFDIPQDTLVANGKSVTFAEENISVGLGDVRLVNPLGREYAVATTSLATTTPAVASSTPSASLDEIALKVSQTAEQLASLSYARVLSSASMTSPAPTPVDRPISLSENAGVVATSELPQVANVFEASRRVSVFDRIFGWPMKGMHFIESLFIEE